MTGIAEFKRALEGEFSKKSAALRDESENFISDRIFVARRETERKVHDIRAGHKKRFDLLLEREKRRTLLKVGKRRWARSPPSWRRPRRRSGSRLRLSAATGELTRVSFPALSGRPLKPWRPKP